MDKRRYARHRTAPVPPSSAAPAAHRFPGHAGPENNEKGARAGNGDDDRCEDDGTLERPVEQQRSQRVEACADDQPDRNESEPGPHGERV